MILQGSDSYFIRCSTLRLLNSVCRRGVIKAQAKACKNFVSAPHKFCYGV